MRIFVLLLYLCSVTVYGKLDASDSHVLVDWHNLIPRAVVCRHFQLDYYPPVGSPPSHSLFSNQVLNVTIQKTLPAAEYYVNVTALIEPGYKSLLLSNLYISTPPRPVLEYLKPDSDGVTFAILSPRKADISYYVEYNEAGDLEQASYVETKQTALRIRGLSPNSNYQLRVYSIFRGTPSTESLTVDFKTKELPSRSNENKHRRPVKPFQYTQPQSTVTQSPYVPYPEYSPQISLPPYLPQLAQSQYPQPTPLNRYQSVNQLAQNTPSYYYMNMTTTPLSIDYHPVTQQSPSPPESFVLPSANGGGYENPPIENSGILIPAPKKSDNGNRDIQKPSAIYGSIQDGSQDKPVFNVIPTFPNRWPDLAVSMPEVPVSLPPPAMNTNNNDVISNANSNDNVIFPVYATAFVETTNTTVPIENPTVETTTPMISEMFTESTTQGITPTETNAIDNPEVTMDKVAEANEFVEYTTPTEVSPTERPVLIVDDPEDLGYSDPKKKISEKEKDKDELVVVNGDVETSEDQKNQKEPKLKVDDDEKKDLTEAEDDKITVTREHQKIRLDWSIPETVFCDNYLINTTVITLKNPKSFTVVSPNTNSYIKMYNGHVVLVKVSCMLENSISNVWAAQRYVDFRRPDPVKGLHVRDVATDEFYVASVILEIEEPSQLADKYDIKVISTNKMIFTGQYIFNISSLEPARLYTFSVRNVSRDTQVESAPIGIRQITAPIITSTLYPGQISSYAINVNYDETASEHLFEGYELVFIGNTKNITKKLSKKDPKTFTFNKLIPGKTYTFILYTVYKNVRSRPVVQDITTYPLKVRKFYAMVGPGYATLAWEVENVANNDCQFRLEYASTSNSGIQKSQKVKLQDVNMYRFTGLQFDTYYTFTITVLMGKGEAVAESESEMITVGFKSRPTSFPTLKRQGSREMLLTFENDPRLFADTNGVVDNFAVIVTQDPELGGDNYELRSYYDIKDEDVWPAYRTSHSNYNPFRRHGSSRVASFVIGEEDCDRRKLNETYCNGVLRSHVDYFVKVRAYLVTNIAMETEWVSVKGLVDDTPHEKGQRRLPCYMYLNGCSKSSANSNKITFALRSLPFVLLIIFLF
ncbi:unnamed protein product [Bursaphelenchus xylophilus]|uniref:protein-tyrosine-phosphatase n=1 Tax=Bursaphelenchus xylophilus TaxID=6326 RepID=A0A811KIH9_BURXY|nr:unnamed protein product [Bursaphelenchus xylophilus]CAG9096949.1 unnamed protein product [Bursaphelenchus xylophilus]